MQYKKIGSAWNEQCLFVKYFGMRLFFLTIPKPLKQYTLFKKRLSIPLFLIFDTWNLVPDS